MPPNEPALLNNVIRTLKLLPVEASIFFDLSGDLKLYGIKTVGELQAISVQRSPITEWGRFAKCITDYAISATAIVFLFPLLVLIAIAIKLDSPGPILFQQRRQGLNGKIIKVLKFRTMTVMEDGDAIAPGQETRSARHARGPDAAADEPRRVAAVSECSQWRNVDRRPSASRDRTQHVL